MSNNLSSDNSNDNTINNSNKKYLAIGVGIFIITSIIIGVTYFSFSKSRNSNTEKANITSQQEINLIEDNDISITPALPSSESDEKDSATNSDRDNAKAEILAFGNFYKQYNEKIKGKINPIELPTNVKISVSNYHDIARKINLDPYIENLNNYGFSVIDNPFPTKSNDFFDAYATLSKMNIPSVITSDFLIYYYQNTLKDIFKTIEKDVFYDDLWNISKSLFVTAKNRYKHRLNEVGNKNDLLLESARLEAAFFATTLQILKPQQIQITADVNKINKFNIKELSKYNFVLPDYLKNDVLPEVNLILSANTSKKSPVLLYDINYTNFNLPNEYKENAKLNNFYLASIWLSSPFPTFYKNSECPDCKLDKEDWLVNQLAAQLIAKDLAENQDIKNKWANIYKTLAYFRGLKQGISYIHLNNTFNELFPNKQLGEIYSRDNHNLSLDLNTIQKNLLKNEFKLIEGGISLNSPELLPEIGMRLLQDQYWPNSYIFNRLTAETGDYMDKVNKKGNPISLCPVNKKGIRCRAIGLDIISLLKEIPETNSYYSTNTNYSEYTTVKTEIINEISEFDTFDWHNNNYWNTLDILNKYVKEADHATPSYQRNENWNNRKINTMLGAWTNIHTEYEEWQKSSEERDTFNTSQILDIYVEPEVSLVRELKSNIEMLKNILLALGIINNNDFTYLKLNNLSNKLTDLLEVIYDELENKSLDYYDLKNLENFIKQYNIRKNSNKTAKFYFGNKKLSISESINNINYIILINEQNGEKKFSLGPIFRHIESVGK